MGDDEMSIFDRPVQADPPPPNSEADYGSKVVTLTPKGKRGQPGWKSDWHLSDNGSPLPTLFNAMVALRNHPKLSTIVRFDEMARSPLIVQQIPGTPDDPSIPRPLSDPDVIAIQEALQATGLRRIAKATVQDAVQLRAEQDRFHPVRNYLDSLEWDGEKRIYGWLGTYLGVEGCAYSDKIGEMFLISLVARIYVPGCKSDHMLILEGPQGSLKSSVCRALGGDWFSDNLPDLSGGDHVRLSMHIRGKWLIEIAELSSFSNAETKRLKAFLTQQEENYTPKYGRNEVFERRQCGFVGTTNETAYLKDDTGGRRFWPVKIGRILLEKLIEDRDQLFAEAVHMFRAGADHYPTKEFEAQHITPEQAARYEEDPWQQEVDTWIRRESVTSATVNEVLRGAIGMNAEKFGTRETRRVSAILQRMGWVRNMKNSRKPYEPTQPGILGVFSGDDR